MRAETTLTEFILEEQRRFPEANGGFAALVNDVRLACKRISLLIGRGALGRDAGDDALAADPGEAADQLFLRIREHGAHLAGLASPRAGAQRAAAANGARRPYLLAFSPLDGAADVDVNAPAGSLFSILRCPEGLDAADARAYLQAGARQACAGYALYGPTTMLVLTLGRGVHGFTLDRGLGEFILTHPSLTLPRDTHELAVDSGNEPHWDPPVRRYVGECVAGRAGPRPQPFRLRWVASLAAEVHRVLIRGGVFLAPREVAALRLVHEANPVAMLVEQAGGAASTGRGRILDLAPASLEQRVPVVLGSCDEVARLERYHREHDAGLDRPFESPLFRERSLFAQG
jgi:fructose-1,6-bisphosphatase